MADALLVQIKGPDIGQPTCRNRASLLKYCDTHYLESARPFAVPQTLVKACARMLFTAPVQCLQRSFVLRWYQKVDLPPCFFSTVKQPSSTDASSNRHIRKCLFVYVNHSIPYGNFLRIHIHTSDTQFCQDLFLDGAAKLLVLKARVFRICELEYKSQGANTQRLSVVELETGG